MLDTAWISKILAPILGLSAGVALADAPARVVSVNLCTDQMAMLMTTPDQLVSISFLATDDNVSAMSTEAGAYATNHGGLEEIVTQEPDLVLVHEWTSPLLVAGLERLGIATKSFATPKRMNDIPRFLTEMGATLGKEAQARDLVSAFQARYADLSARASRLPQDARVVSYGPGGWVSGTDSVSAELITRAGFADIAPEYGLEFGGFMPLEVLVTAKPDVVLTGTLYPASSRSETLLAHPALTASQALVHPMQFGNAWGCGLPQSLDGFEELIELHEDIAGAVS